MEASGTIKHRLQSAISAFPKQQGLSSLWNTRGKTCTSHRVLFSQLPIKITTHSKYYLLRSHTMYMVTHRKIFQLSMLPERDLVISFHEDRQKMHQARYYGGRGQRACKPSTAAVAPRPALTPPASL